MDSAVRAGRSGGRHAVVVGGSLAGLLAAQVLAGHADRVTVIERDRYPEGPEPRAGVPQGRHPHVLLQGGQSALEALLPGFLAELRESGSPYVGMPSDLVLWQAGRWLRRVPAQVYIYTGSRAQLEGLVRRRVLANPLIDTVQGTEVVGLLGDASRVRGVLVRERSGEARAAEPRALEADLVVDASGSGTKAPQWLAGIGAVPPHEETLDTGLAYASRVYRGPKGVLDGETTGYYVYPGPDQPNGGGALPLEDGSHLVIVSGLRGDEPPTDPDEFTAYAKRLGHPLLDRWMAEAEPLSAPFGYRRTANIRRRYDLPGPPAGFLATGDALCTFNPIYGQGMAAAAMSAVALRDALTDPRRTPTTRRVQRALLAASRQAWDISAGADRKMPGALGNAVDGGSADRFAEWYLRRVMERTAGDPVVGAAFRSVLSLSSPVSALFAPRVARAVLFGRPLPTPTEPPEVPESGA
ncbi:MULTISPECIES: NAD(P)/FAD-dependent oxidoreductase [Streptomyces]|uniref:FAD-dependent monooxygenase n=1 Tax=Streptomyces fuscus TaxID=3048495 RepID=A0ABT7JBW7_9ACTN|nr:MULTISPECIES: FAD-dependent monooxygenase [Streptomyces]MCM1976349.1 FAD-dependent monooxygenase [Streptomyces sp. G1]MDL2081272.1 FAD-dependent monooxygenase [Streptomyces fuscus]SBT90977.1 2-polyprenyl-6-methoxyphenol hydroxylase [Streptomyces sp. DI166]